MSHILDNQNKITKKASVENLFFFSRRKIKQAKILLLESKTELIHDIARRKPQD